MKVTVIDIKLKHQINSKLEITKLQTKQRAKKHQNRQSKLSEYVAEDI